MASKNEKSMQQAGSKKGDLSSNHSLDAQKGEEKIAEISAKNPASSPGT
jgi:hypothetical protein